MERWWKVVKKRREKLPRFKDDDVNKQPPPTLHKPLQTRVNYLRFSPTKQGHSSHSNHSNPSMPLPFCMTPETERNRSKQNKELASQHLGIIPSLSRTSSFTPLASYWLVPSYYSYYLFSLSGNLRAPKQLDRVVHLPFLLYITLPVDVDDHFLYIIPSSFSSI